ncbi:MAG: hypothetical protein Q7S92_05835 [Candidatus Diapherotrites archaeon]|nr:hypothetical protein [Candidatus Diapherotrites archaeon]
MTTKVTEGVVFKTSRKGGEAAYHVLKRLEVETIPSLLSKQRNCAELLIELSFRVTVLSEKIQNLERRLK